MKSLLFVACVLSGISGNSRYQAPGSTGVEGVFVGSLPCGAQVQNFLGLQAGAQCEVTKWRLTLRDSAYSLELGYGIWVDNQTYRTTATRTITGRARAHANTSGARLLTLEAAGRALCFLQTDANLLHLTDNGQKLLPCPADFIGYNYTLSREQPLPPGEVYGVFPPRRPDTAQVSVFEGRTPCTELLAAAGVPANPVCTKLKWRLILHRRPQTGEPAYYEVSNTLNGHVPRRGNWRIVQGKAGQVYQLEGAYSLYLLRGDDNVLFFTDKTHHLLPGNAHFGYTLGRVR